MLRLSIERIAVGLNVELFMKHLHLFHGMAYKDPQTKKEYNKVWYQRNKENRRQQIKKYKEENREKMTALEKIKMRRYKVLVLVRNW